MLQPDAGTVEVFGVDVWADPVPAKQLLGVLPDRLALPERLTGRELLTFLGEPFEALDPVSAATIRLILRRFVDSGGSVVMSSHVMAMVEQLCDHVAVIAGGRLVAAGTLDAVRDGTSLDDAFVRLFGARARGAEGLSWLAS